MHFNTWTQCHVENILQCAGNKILIVDAFPVGRLIQRLPAYYVFNESDEGPKLNDVG